MVMQQKTQRPAQFEITERSPVRSAPRKVADRYAHARFVDRPVAGLTTAHIQEGGITAVPLRHRIF